MGDLFFSLLLYHKLKNYEYEFYDCLVSHEGAYIDINRFVDPSETLSIAFKVYPEDWDTAITRPMYKVPQQWILCARRDRLDPNSVMISQWCGWDASLYSWDMDPDDCIIIDNGGSEDFHNRTHSAHYDLEDAWFGKKIVVVLKPKGKTVYDVNTEHEWDIDLYYTTPRSLDDGSRALLKLFAGFEPSHGGFVYNTVTSRIYYFYIQNSNQEYTLRMQPARRVETDEYGMYDVINDKFYPNKNSIGYFTVEENISDKIILDVESQVDTKRYCVYCNNNTMPYQLNDNRLVLVKKHDLPPITEGFIDLWDGMGKQSDEVGIFNNVTLQRNDTGDVTYTDNGDGSVTVNAPVIPGHGYDYTRWAYQLPNIAVGSMVIVGKCSDGFVIMNYPGDTISTHGSFRWFDEGRSQNNITEDYVDTDYSSIFTANNPHTYTASGDGVIAEGGTLFGVQYARECNITIYGMALYTTILTKEQLLEVAHWLDRYVKRPQSTTRSIEENP